MSRMIHCTLHPGVRPDRVRGGVVLLAMIPLALLGGSVAGCGPGGARVSGRVTLDGRPLETGAVQFVAEGGGQAAHGSIGADGRFSLRLGNSSGTIPPGRYTATVVAVSTPEQIADDTRGEVLPVPITPARYGDISTSGLIYDLQEGTNTIEIPLVRNPSDHQ